MKEKENRLTGGERQPFKLRWILHLVNSGAYVRVFVGVPLCFSGLARLMWADWMSECAQPNRLPHKGLPMTLWYCWNVIWQQQRKQGNNRSMSSAKWINAYVNKTRLWWIVHTNRLQMSRSLRPETYASMWLSSNLFVRICLWSEICETTIYNTKQVKTGFTVGFLFKSFE